MKLITRNENKPGYKETKIGWIPKEWDLQPLGKIGAFSKGKGITNSQKKKSGLPCITYGEIYTKHDFIIKEFKSFIDQETAESSQLILQNDILFAGSGETLDEIGKCVTNPFTNKVFAGGDIVILTPSGNDSLFLSLLINSNYITRFRRKLGQGHSVVHIYSSGLKTLDIPLPPLPEQKKIAAILSTWDKAISNYELLNKNYELRKKGLMQKLLSGEVRFPGFTEPWKEVSIGSLVKEIDRDITWDDNKEYKLISVRRRSGGLFHRENLIGHQIKTKTLKKIQTNDFLISKMQIVHGASGLTTNEFDEMYVSASYHCLVPKNEELIDIEFFNYFSQLPWFYHLTYLASHGVHIEKMTFKLKDLLKFKILIPTEIREQKKIVKVINGVGNEIKLLKNEKAALEQQKKGLMQKLLTGTVRVKPIKN